MTIQQHVQYCMPPAQRRRRGWDLYFYLKNLGAKSSVIVSQVVNQLWLCACDNDIEHNL